MTSMVIPDDIWRCIAGFLTPDFLATLYSVNAVLFDLSMNLRHRELDLAQFTDAMASKLFRCHRYPQISRRLRVLRIRPSFIHGILSALPETSSEEAMAHLTALLSLPSNLREYHILWSEFPALFQFPRALLAAPLNKTPSLRKLTLELSLDDLTVLLHPETVLQDLEHLEICIRSNRQPKVLTIPISIAQFINNFSPNLTRLSLKSCAPIESSEFFLALTQFPSLSAIAISIPIYPPHLGQQLGLQSFLNHHHETITSFCLKACHVDRTGCSNFPTPVAYFRLDQLPSARPLFSGISLPYLTSLSVENNAANVKLGISCIKQLLQPTLTSLEFVGQVNILLDDIETMVRDAGGLHRLTLGTVILCPQLIDILAKHLPHLQYLDITMRFAVPNLLPRGVWRSTALEITEFISEMHSRVYPQWTKLSTIHVRKLAVGISTLGALEAECVTALERCLPNAS
ncbi:hypothetical protein C8J56DRAFT_1061689 [Mycena floridula]|nr:hypothetical protein C8J56DRAFT_1061689 [Mycena floridula]